jgi:hypothetical protein
VRDIFVTGRVKVSVNAHWDYYRYCLTISLSFLAVALATPVLCGVFGGDAVLLPP